MSGHRLLTLLAVTALCAGGAACTGDPNSELTSPAAGSSPATSPARPGLVAPDVEYATVGAASLPALADVYAPAAAEGAPLVVIVHGGGNDKDADPYPQLAAALVERGLVVVVSNWGPADPDLSVLEDDIVGELTASGDEMACALAFAAERAKALGADPSHLVAVGHSAGANLLALAVLTPRRPFPGCLATEAAPAVSGLVLWEGDWFASSAGDALGDRTVDFFTAYSPWPSLGSITTDVPIELVMANPDNGGMLSLPATPRSEFMTQRDPSGEVTRTLQEVGAFDDGELDVYDSSRGFSRALSEHGIDNTLVVLEDPRTTHDSLAGGDVTTVVDHVVGLATG